MSRSAETAAATLELGAGRPRATVIALSLVLHLALVALGGLPAYFAAPPRAEAAVTLP